MLTVLKWMEEFDGIVIWYMLFCVSSCTLFVTQTEFPGALVAINLHSFRSQRPVAVLETYAKDFYFLVWLSHK